MTGESGSSVRTPRERRLEKVTLVVAGVVGLALAYTEFMYYVPKGTLMFDAHAYWLTGQPEFQPYSLPPGYVDAFLYSPAFAQLIAPLTQLPWTLFGALWMAVEASAFLWLFRPFGLAWAVVGLLWCAPELAIGNIVGFIAVATVLALTSTPQAWALPILTKPALGIGLLWHVVRAEWRRLVVALATTLAIVGVSFALDPEMWRLWVEFLATSAGGGGTLLPVRILVAAALVVVSARSGRRWAVPFAMVLGTPVIGGPPVLMLLAAVPRLVIAGREPVATKASDRRAPSAA